MLRLRPIFPALSLLVLAAPAHAQSAVTGFQSPSKNIACQYFDYDKQNVLRCDLSVMETKPRRPTDCDLDYGQAFEMNAKGPAARICHGDTVMDKSLPVLAYGEVWQRGGFTCTSEQAGVTCFNTDRRGFSLARVKQEMF
ncbi:MULTISPECIES: DUF6636 domain-containing protein [unclassified Bradyrhizobium]|uniref:DUF6636 domain-containing protein n=1 Tax=unclassified Bradyrhizobium TaxID=2631580 RepID=UPI002FEF4D43